MSSIYISDVEMPTSCEKCKTVFRCCDYSEDGTVWCRLARGYVGDERTVCPLAPAADVRPVVRGLNICDTVNGHCEFKCSVCGVELSSVYGGNNDFGLDGGYFNFCPNCGADMREEQNDPNNDI